MADIAKALDMLAAKGPRKLAYVLGIPAMRETYVDAFTHAATTTRTEISADEDLPDILGATHLSPGRHVTVVRGAQHLTDASAKLLVTWASTRTKDTHVLLVAEYPTWPKTGPKREAQFVHPALREVFTNPRTSTLLIEGVLADTLIGHTKAADVVRHLTHASRTEAAFLARTCGYDLTRIKDTCAKTRILGTYAERHVTALAGREAPAEYVDALLACNKPLAASTALYVPTTAYVSTLNRLDYALDVLARIHRAMKENDSTHALAQRMGIHRTVVDHYRPLAKHYGSSDVAKRSTALLWAAQQVAKGRREGTLEMIAVQW